MLYWASLVAQTVKNRPAVWETRAQSLGWEDPLGKGMATHTSILTWSIPMEPGRLQSLGLHRVRHDWVTKHTLLYYIFVYIYICCVYIYIYIYSHVYNFICISFASFLDFFLLDIIFLKFKTTGTFLAPIVVFQGVNKL